MNDETVSPQEETTDEQFDTTDPALVEAMEKIKHPLSINETLMAQSKDELTSNPVVVPEMLNESTDLRGDLKRDE
ncbi:MAG: hypothetical protein KME08_20420 [Aphanothece sp. CMT-3BRIN-NPC111]|jgi:hypothetical protein|nr:hypothetical protein [Aphanothece sp. CMT-3BRIN-NPC111]